jgi:uncharacterized protein (TIGR03437 family)
VAAAFLLLAAFFFRPCLWSQDDKAPPPAFTPDSIVNSANGSSASLAPNGLATLYGSDLAFSTESIDALPSQLPVTVQIGSGLVTVSVANPPETGETPGATGRKLPNALAGVRISIGGITVPLLYVSPTRINFLIPADLLSGPADLSLTRQGVERNRVRINLLQAAPGVFAVENGVVATHPDGSSITAASPAKPGEIIRLYCAGLGQTNPPQVDGVVPNAAAQISIVKRMQVWLDGQLLPAERILYAGITPGFAGLYQIAIRLPEDGVRPDPCIQVTVDDQRSQDDLILPMSPAATAEAAITDPAGRVAPPATLPPAR